MIDEKTFDAVEDRSLTTALNDVALLKPVPPALADRIALVGRGLQLRRESSRPRGIPRWLKVAAALAALASFVSFAAVVRVTSSADSHATSSILDFHSISSDTSFNSRLENKQGETEMNIKQKAVAALTAATLSATPMASGAILSGDAAAERIVLSNRVVLVYSANGTL